MRAFEITHETGIKYFQFSRIYYLKNAMLATAATHYCSKQANRELTTSTLCPMISKIGAGVRRRGFSGL